MIAFRHRKVAEASFVSHIDTVKVLQRAMRRMKADVRYSEGFVPHMLTYATTPLPLGVQSKAEYFIADSPLEGSADLLKKFNECVPEGFKADFCAVIDRNPNLAANVVASEYIVNARGSVSKEICDIIKQKEYYITQQKKGELVESEVRDRIFAIDTSLNKIRLVLATGNINLRVDAFLNSLIKNYGVNATANDVLRVEQYVRKEGKFVAAKEILV